MAKKSFLVELIEKHCGNFSLIDLRDLLEVEIHIKTERHLKYPSNTLKKKIEGLEKIRNLINSLIDVYKIEKKKEMVLKYKDQDKF